MSEPSATPAPSPTTPSPAERKRKAPGPVERALETFIFASRWLMAPFYVALVAALAALLVKAAQHTWHFVGHIVSSTESELILGLLSLVDLSLTGSLVLIVIFSGYENFVSRIDAAEHTDWPEWMGKIDFTGLKLKLLSSIVAISAVQLLRAFLDIRNTTDRDLGWQVGIHLLFVVSGLVLALTDKISHDGGH
jgi:uncharacterized protein (TIGR00645 family)